MPFGLTNAPTKFCTHMNDVIFDLLDSFVVVYLDDIMIYSQTLENHLVHLEKVFDRLRQNQKCEFAQDAAEQRYNSHEKEMTVVIHCLETWKHYLMGTRFTVVTDKVVNTFYKTQKKLDGKSSCRL